MRTVITALLIGVILISQSQAASWKSCKKRKQEAVRLEQALGKGKKLKGYKSGAAMKKARRNHEQWLWKNCRYYSSRLRDLEQELM
ncbi:hypothetical protein IMCC21906_00750 [Spongiibacter sp. IMCC21906]|uniref:hypothetical protein n=1 Tax=Spongiibacter sp. IMCC21906 TaxID=1620392 RepID=UPI00062DEB4D|nr:hypothetical protein [Spongiibacter sp. IMCC21906]AKH68442.1 hypothetical protein IMCC21906_00750 [Spongiibacter sp. IMCC21906]